jgi:hypothetical protein
MALDRSLSKPKLMIMLGPYEPSTATGARPQMVRMMWGMSLQFVSYTWTS